jgi:hypothetical protein
VPQPAAAAAAIQAEAASAKVIPLRLRMDRPPPSKGFRWRTPAYRRIPGKVWARHRPGIRLGFWALLCAAGCGDHVGGSVDAATESGGDSGRDGAVESAAEAASLACTMPFDCEGPTRCCINGVCSNTPPASCADARELAIMVSSYDQSCSVDSDCATAANVTTCFGPVPCSAEPIAKSALSQYQSDVAMLPATPCAFLTVNCTPPPTLGFPFGLCCRSGSCQVGAACGGGGDD